MENEYKTLTVVLCTYNRLPLLKKCLRSILGKIDISHEIIVIDAGSTDGTLDYLNKNKNKIRLIADGKKMGQVRSLNQVLRKLKSDLVCWLSDDNIVIPKMIDTAANILQKDNTIGMVALKVKDVSGEYTKYPYIGGISAAGILNANQECSG